MGDEAYKVVPTPVPYLSPYLKLSPHIRGLMKLISVFIKKFICKYLKTVVIERIIIILLDELVMRTESKIDDKIYKAIFEKVDSECL